MLYELLILLLGDETVLGSPLRIFAYTSVRGFLALVTAFVLSLLLGPPCIRRLTRLKLGQQVRQFKGDLEQFNIHQHKMGTPTMGGLILLASGSIAILLFCDPRNSYVWVALFVLLAAGLLGFLDDWYKVARKNHKGVSGRQKLAVQIILGLLLGAFMLFSPSHTSYLREASPQQARQFKEQQKALQDKSDQTVQLVKIHDEAGAELIHSERLGAVQVRTQGDHHLLVPFFKNLYPALGLLFLPWAALVLTASSNSVNLTDGLDGLAIGCFIAVALPYLVIAYIVSRHDYSADLFLPHVPQARDLVIFLSALLGAALGFLWFNAHPAQVFMGDTGSLSLGAVLGTVALLTKHELLLVFIGSIFVIEAASVILQVWSYRVRGKRILLMSPLHNHFVKKNIAEEKILARFLIVALLLAMAGLGALKLR